MKRASLRMAVAGVGGRRLAAGGRARAVIVLILLAIGVGIAAGVAGLPWPVLEWSSGGNLPVPVFSLETPAGGMVSSDRFRGHVVVLAFWATWCTPCRQELPELQRAYERQMRSRKALFYAVDGPWGGDTAAMGSAFAARMNLTVPLALDAHGAARTLDVEALPTVVILDTHGRVRLHHDGYEASDHLGSQVAAEVAVLSEGR